MNAFEAARQVSAIEAAQKLALPMKRTGARYVARCLFHQDNSPSMTLYPGTGGFYCFGCHQHGDATRLYQQALGLNALEAARRVCADFHLTYENGKRRAPPSAPRADVRVLRKQILDWRERRVKALVERRTQLAAQMAAREDEMYHEELPFDQWWDDPAWASAKEEHDQCEEEILRLDCLQLTDLWHEWQETKGENDELSK